MRRTLEGLFQASELALAAHHRRVEPPRLLLVHLEQAEGGHGLRLTLELEGLDRHQLDRSAHEARGLGAQQDGARSRRFLEPRCDVDGVPGREPFLRARDDLAGVDPDPRLDAEPGQRVQDLRCGPHRPQSVVLVQRRDAEHGHHGVAHELLDRSSMAFHDLLDALEVAEEERTQGLRIDRLAEGGRAFDVAEEHGHRLPVLACGHRFECCSAVGAEREVAFALSTAARTGGHESERRHLAPSWQRSRAALEASPECDYDRPTGGYLRPMSRSVLRAGSTGHDRKGGAMSDNLEKLVGAGVVTTTELPDPYREVIDGLTDDEVDILTSVMKRLTAAEHLHQGEPWTPGGSDPLFKTYVLF